MSHRVLVVANKSWEADPLLGVLLSPPATPLDLARVRVVRHPFFMHQRRGPDPEAQPRIEIDLPGPPAVTVEVWCVEDLMNPSVSGSSSAEKARVLPRALSYRPEAAALVVAFGTASTPEEAANVGGVAVGSSAFIHDPDTDVKDRWKPPRPDALIPSVGLPGGLFHVLENEARAPAEARFLAPPLAAARPPVLLAGSAFVALGNVNITNYADYGWADPELLAIFTKEVGGRVRVGSLETTHGVIREASDAPFLFVSGLANEIGRFDYQVAPRVYAQNFVAAHNAGVAVGWLLPHLPALFG